MRGGGHWLGDIPHGPHGRPVPLLLMANPKPETPMDDATDFDLLCMAVWLWVVTPLALWLISYLLRMM